MRLALALLLAMASPADMTNFRKLAEKDMKASVLLHMKGVERDKQGVVHQIVGGCSGTYIDSTHILTAGHCFSGYQMTHTWARGEEDVLGYPVHLVAIDLHKDLAVVEAAFPHAYAKLGNMPKVGDEVLNIGSPLFFEFVASQGIVGCLYVKVRGFTGRYIVTTAMINPGSSGGGVFDRKGHLVGVNTMSVGMFGWTGISMAVDLDTIHQFLADHSYVFTKA